MPQNKLSYDVQLDALPSTGDSALDDELSKLQDALVLTVQAVYSDNTVPSDTVANLSRFYAEAGEDIPAGRFVLFGSDSKLYDYKHIYAVTSPYAVGVILTPTFYCAGGATKGATAELVAKGIVELPYTVPVGEWLCCTEDTVQQLHRLADGNLIVMLGKVAAFSIAPTKVVVVNYHVYEG